jgi:hypothetical protein
MVLSLFFHQLNPFGLASSVHDILHGFIIGQEKFLYRVDINYTQPLHQQDAKRYLRYKQPEKKIKREKTQNGDQLPAVGTLTTTKDSTQSTNEVL